MIGFYRSCLASILVGVSVLAHAAGESQSQQRLVLTEEPSDIGVFPLPSPGDNEVITSIAKLGTPRQVLVPGGTSVAKLIAGICNRPSAAELVHPAYKADFLLRNPSISPDELTSLRSALKVVLPACAKFQEVSGVFAAPRGVADLAARLSIPFDAGVFSSVSSAPESRCLLAQDLPKAIADGQHGDFQRTTDKLCKRDTRSYFSCLNAVVIAAANPNFTSSGPSTEITIPPTARDTPPGELVRIPLDRNAANAIIAARSAENSSTAGTAMVDNWSVGNWSKVVGNWSTFDKPGQRLNEANLWSHKNFASPSFPDEAMGFSTLWNSPEPVISQRSATAPMEATIRPQIEPVVNFVTEIGDASKLKPACSNAAVLRRGSWPFDAARFLRALSLSEIMNRSTSLGKILLVDSGFDFSPDPRTSRNSRTDLVFPPKYFYRLDDQYDPNPHNDREWSRDVNGDHVPGNGGWVGVNLADRTIWGESTIKYKHRSHGLAVATLALGGRDLEQFRRLASLPVRLGIASIVSLDEVGPNDENRPLSKDDVVLALKYAAGIGNNFTVINMSLASRSEIEGLDGTLASIGRGRVIVVSAGNDGKKLLGSNRVWPAALGGRPRSVNSDLGVVITVGAQDADGEVAEFSNWGEDVDLLAPGCMVPTYKLSIDNGQNVRGLDSDFSTGTSFAAPIVSFISALLIGGPPFDGQPGLVKSRLLRSSDFKPDLWEKTWSSGTLDVAKAIAYNQDIFEIEDSNGDRSLKFGRIVDRGKIGAVSCGGGGPVAFADIRKLARDPRTGKVLLLSNSDSSRPSEMDRQMCDVSALKDLTFKFEDVEDGKTRSFAAGQILDSGTGLPGGQIVDYIPSDLW